MAGDLRSKDAMITTALDEFKNHLSSYMEKASEQDVVITSDGRHIRCSYQLRR